MQMLGHLDDTKYIYEKYLYIDTAKKKLKKNWTLDKLTQTLFTSAVCPKNVCFGDSSLTSHNLQDLSTDPVT